jgi:hypothetical protein
MSTKGCKNYREINFNVAFWHMMQAVKVLLLFLSSLSLSKAQLDIKRVNDSLTNNEAFVKLTTRNSDDQREFLVSATFLKNLTNANVR